MSPEIIYACPRCQKPFAKRASRAAHMGSCGKGVPADYPDVRTCYEQGFSILDVAAKTGHSVAVVRHYLRRLGLVRRDRAVGNRLRLETTTGVTSEQIVRAYLDGDSMAAVGKKLRVSTDYVQDTLERAGVPRRSRADSRRLSSKKHKSAGKCWTCKSPNNLLSNGYCRPCMAERQRARYGLEAHEPKKYWQLEVSGNLSASERMLVLRCARFMAEGGDKNPETILTEAGIGWRRQVTLMSCAIALAKEQGVQFGNNLKESA